MSEAQTAGQETTATGEPQETLPTGSEGIESPQAKPTEAPAPGAEAEVVYEFKTPEGMEFAQGDLDELKTIAKDLKLPNEQAQRLVDLAAKREQARAEVFATTVAGWAEQTKNDKELGKPENLATAKKTIDTFGTPELRDLLNSSGMGNHPEVIRMALKIGKAISEDTFVAGRTGAAPTPRSHAEVLYGTPPTK